MGLGCLYIHHRKFFRHGYVTGKEPHILPIKAKNSVETCATMTRGQVRELRMQQVLVQEIAWNAAAWQCQWRKGRRNVQSGTIGRGSHNQIDLINIHMHVNTIDEYHNVSQLELRLAWNLGRIVAFWVALHHICDRPLLRGRIHSETTQARGTNNMDLQNRDCL
jgi:hypothetical protein